MTEKGHRCGGRLQPREVQVRDEGFVYRVPGLVCDACGQELIDRETALAVEKSNTPTVIWEQPPASSRLDESQFISAPRVPVAV